MKPGGHGRTLSPASVAQAYRTLNRVLAAAVDDEMLGRNPLAGVKPPRAEPEPMRFLSPDEVATLAAVIDERYRAIVLVAAYGGLRAGELIGLRRKHVDLLRHTITVVEQVQFIGGRAVTSQPKTNAGRRSVALPGVVAAALEEHLPAFAEPGVEGLVFPAPEGGFLRIENFRKRVWAPATVAAGVAPLRLHDLRHTVAGHRGRRRRQGSAADARPLFGVFDPRPLWTPAPRSGTERGGKARRDGPRRDANVDSGDHDDFVRGIFAGSSLTAKSAYR